jgi:hypothetical protein
MGARAIVVFLIVTRLGFCGDTTKKVQKEVARSYRWTRNSIFEYFNPPIMLYACRKVERLARFLVYLNDTP